MYIILFIILFIILLLIYFSNIDEKNVNSNTKEIIKEDNCFLYDNINRTQLVYKKLMNATKYLSKKMQLELKDNCVKNVYIQGTFSDLLKIEIAEIAQLILNKLNHRTGLFFKIIDYDNITEIKDNHNNKNFDFHVFVQDPQEQITIRLHINVIKYVFEPYQHKKYLTCAQATTPEFPKFEIGYPRPDQFLPLPTEVITTGAGGFSLNNNGIDIPNPAPIRYLFINKIEVYNTNWILQPDKRCKQVIGVGGYYNVPFDHAPFNGPKSSFQEPNCVANKWIETPDKPKNAKIWNCAYQPFEWNDKGILVSSCKNKPECIGYQTSSTIIPARPSFWRANYGIPTNGSGLYSWLFDLTRGDPSINGADFSDNT